MWPAKTKNPLDIIGRIGYNVGMARNFGSRMTAIGDVLNHNASMIIRKAAQAIANEVILRTPVATGRARINWKASFKTPKTTQKEGPDTPNKNTNAQVAASEALINATNVIKNWKVGQGNIFIANSVHYIGDLDDGTSRQARAGMTKFAVAAARAILKEGRLLRGR